MQELLVDFIISLDGYGAATGWPGFWGLEGPEYLAWLGEQSQIDHTFLLGANTYRVMSEMQPAAESEDESMDAFGKATKLVFSSTLQAPLAWPNAELVREDAVEVVRGMKKNGSKPLSTLGSLSLCRALLKAGLVDRYRVVIFPVITGATGHGRIFDGYPDVALELVSSQTFDDSIQLLEYVPSVLDGPPGS